MLPVLLSSFLLTQTPDAPKAAPQAPAQPQALKPLSFFSRKYPYRWDTVLKLEEEVDGLKLNTIFFNRREIASGLLKGAEFGTR
ncbi:MAG: hypothetical protein LWX11_02755, partial [Firmicutes bacterium]|nr:hypothetical protein [Bacillota bacterium]